jgi:hypothetical protein
MTTADGDEFWRRPAEPPPTAPPPAARPTAEPRYSGPPPTVRPVGAAASVPLIPPSRPRRELPPQDHAALDAEDERAAAVTLGVGIVTGAVLFLLLVLVVVRAGADIAG